MKITTVRRISQVFFFLLFVWFAVAASVGEKFWQLRGWPVNLFLDMDPLVGLGTLLSTGEFYWPLLWGAGVLILTVFVGRFFCSWVCPFGSIHHFVGYVGKRGDKASEMIGKNRYRKGQSVKYYLLIVFLFMAVFPLGSGSVQSGLLDPIPLVTRSFNLVIVPLADKAFNVISVSDRFYEGAWLVLGVFFAAVGLNLFVPRFYCRFVCPLGALFGICGGLAVWRIGRKNEGCTGCKMCEKNCEGGCEPTGEIKFNECVLCFNCLDDCVHGVIGYGPGVSLSGERQKPDVSRRGFITAAIGGLAAVPAIRLAGKLGQNWEPGVIRPPGALEESAFLQRCIKCGQCMRVCPTNVIQPGSLAGGVENLYTPVLNNRIGTSGCQLNCVACGQVCPTSAIRPISLDEKLGLNNFADRGPVKLGTAFVDRSRCLPWAMGRPCIVCQENCPVSPKAIYVKEEFLTMRDGVLEVEWVHKSEGVEGAEVYTVRVMGEVGAENIDSGDIYLEAAGGERFKVVGGGENILRLQGAGGITEAVREGDEARLKVRLQRPYVDPELCIGCGVCEHECPVSGKRAIRVSAEGESRGKERNLLLG